jgi:hypothetical protein
MKRKGKSGRRNHARWAVAEVKTLKRLAGRQSLIQIARTLKRTPGAVQMKASVAGISLRRRPAVRRPRR